MIIMSIPTLINMDQIKLTCNLDLPKEYKTNEECVIWKSPNEGTYMQFVCSQHKRMKNCLGDEPNNLSHYGYDNELSHMLDWHGYRKANKYSHDFMHGTNRNHRGKEGQ